MANRYWVGGSGDWGNVSGSNWAMSSGGSGGFSAPGVSDTAVFDANSGGGVVTVLSNQNVVGGLDTTGFTGSFAGQAAKVSGTVTLGVSVSLNVPVGYTASIDTNGYSIGNSYLYGTVSFVDAVSATSLTFGASSVVAFKDGTTNTISSFEWPSSRMTSEIKSSDPGSQATLSDSGGINVLNHIQVTDIAFAGGATWYSGTIYLDGGNNTGITSAPPSTSDVSPLFGVVA